ncbi:oxidoreductase domain protein [Pseudopedobacter saltans DSM 12145]|uniref:Oxidoreductase domain protein n=1 Tax=Pseudopedobacter saltans (strain ATCC 51119 / DSM 12145 / JCM 21818 / CCUG 39354 / LMG 10337 / NBRC 100064 / NCIMB 13643) TaxID=762903 RepID=F0S745_PSESL|nr:Gfo/Idh/MocA family oxidoreductase [Pseudopedobacter saltans]ADY54318.1 oxidoreductase domain protein [Pseudopedobacter saltans DSM 12145]
MRKLKLAMIGGGPGAFIGAVHRIAARMDNLYDIVAGSFSSSAEKSKITAKELGISPDRAYATYQDLINKEKQLPEDVRVDVVCIVTPNHLHFEPAKLALENGFHVILDKPITLALSEAKELKKLQKESGKELLLTHTYTGYPMVKEAKQQIASGALGKIRKVYVEYPQGWLSNAVESKQADWRTDPSKSGIAGAMGDIGTHAFNLAEYVSGLEVNKLCADINTVVPNRRLDDDGAVLLRFNNGASGVLMATQIAAGEENKVKIRAYGEKGGLEWHQEDANSLMMKWLDAPAQIFRTGGSYVSSFASHNTRTPAGHPEGYLEAFANLYRNFALTVLLKKEGKEVPKEYLDFPGVEEGIRGMAFIETVIASGKSDEKWVELTI